MLFLITLFPNFAFNSPIHYIFRFQSFIRLAIKDPVDPCTKGRKAISVSGAVK